MSFCKECGSEVHGDDVFCPECGVSLEGKGATVKSVPKEPAVPRPKRKQEPAIPKPKTAEPGFPTPKKEPVPPKPKKKKVKKLTVGWLLGWIFGIIFIIFGISGLEIGPGGLLLILLASMLLPPVQAFMRNRLHIELSGGMKIILIVILFAGVGIIENAKQEKQVYVDDYYYEDGWCEPYWECYDWSECTDGVHFRECWDSNYCETDDGRPEEKEECYADEVYDDDYYLNCKPDWECTEWGECVNRDEPPSGECEGLLANACFENENCQGIYGSSYCSSEGICTADEVFKECVGIPKSMRYRDCWDINYCEEYESRPLMEEECYEDW